MKRLLLIGGLFALTLPALAKQAPATAPTSKAHVLTVAELDQWLDKPEEVVLIDVRRPDEVSTIGGFPVYLSIQLSQLESSISWIPRNRKIITVSNHAARAGKAADLLASKGFTVIGAVGADSYEKEGGHRVVHIAIPPPKAANP